MTKYSRENLLRVDNHILEFPKNKENLNREFIVNEISLENLKNIFISKSNDYELFSSYNINELQAEMINKKSISQIPFDFENFEYYFQRYGEYE